MPTWAIVTLVLGTSAITSLLTFFITKMQVTHSDKQLEKQLEKTREADFRQRRREVRSEPLLVLRAELARMASKQDKLVAAAHKLHTRFEITEEEAKKQLKEAADNWNTYVASGDLPQTLFLQYDPELVDKVKEIIRDYQNSYVDATLYYSELKAKERTEATEVFERNEARIIEVQELINKRLEEL